MGIFQNVWKRFDRSAREINNAEAGLEALEIAGQVAAAVFEAEDKRRDGKPLTGTQKLEHVWVALRPLVREMGARALRIAIETAVKGMSKPK
jgi:hypothetical protein